ncbi:methylecgonone reductase isoform X2 [Populus alba]|uniref:Methylecgonone reductase-like isoform X2 n=1 Tax=Populus alba x Populus x berolinensis TaxID=444605 RepID=A0AAD6M222_9ROSI|nr:methylecgonone reductase-like isoform X2 [Populus alba]KAJ6976934.1 methylecgonone reductase-like isoform X2 [Populus alba x Populus x berolinensis]
MKKTEIPEVLLSSGHKMPLIGMGTVAVPLPPPETLVPVFINAIESGYRHFDSAALYGSEESLGQAVAEALDRGLLSSREDLSITSKLWCPDAHRDLVLPALKKSLQRLRLEYVDLYLIHMPARVKQEVEGLNFSEEDLLPFDIKGTWEAMEECSRLGLCKSIGVEMNAVWQQKKLVELCKEKGIHVSAWSPLGANGASWGSLAVMESPILKEIAAAKEKSVSQIALRWIHEQGASVIVKSFNKERMKLNLQIFDWELSTEDTEKINIIPQRRGYSGEVFISKDYGPYKSLEEFWDDDIDNCQ